MHAREILDSRGNPTIEVEILTEEGVRARASVPSGASTGKYEAHELRDADPQRYNGKGVLRAIRNIHDEIAPHIIGLSVLDQAYIDHLLCRLDGTPNKSRLGANAILGVSLAVARAGANLYGLPLWQWLGGQRAHILPLPLVNVLNGGKHAPNPLDVQEFMLVPWGFPTFHEAIEATVRVFRQLQRLLEEKQLATGIGDEGGVAPQIATTKEALSLLMQAIERAGFTPDDHFALALDVASSELYDSSTQTYHIEGKTLTPDQWLTYWEHLINHYPIVSIEDLCAEDDWHTWQVATTRWGKHLQLVGDDLFVTNPNRLQQGITQHVANAILIKPNQIGTLTETLHVIELAQFHHYGTIISHRSGETEDPFIADLAVAVHARQIKTGGVTRTDRLAKYNQLLRIEEQLGGHAEYAGPHIQTQRQQQQKPKTSS